MQSRRKVRGRNRTQLLTHCGSCACGAVTIEAAGDPATVSMCHCQPCQKRTGNSYSVHACFSRTTAGETRSHLRKGDTGCTITFHFCPVCASTLHWDVEAMPDMIGIPVGVFADPSFPSPTTSIFVPQKHPWVVVPNGVPQKDNHSAAFLDAARAALPRRAGDGP